jgi:hypothetical protein
MNDDRTILAALMRDVTKLRSDVDELQRAQHPKAKKIRPTVAPFGFGPTTTTEELSDAELAFRRLRLYANNMEQISRVAPDGDDQIRTGTVADALFRILNGEV